MSQTLYNLKILTSITKLALESEGIDALVMADPAESVLMYDAEEAVLLMLPEPVLRSSSPVLAPFLRMP